MSVPLKFSFNRDILAGAGDLALTADAGDTALVQALVKMHGSSEAERSGDPRQRRGRRGSRKAAGHGIRHITVTFGAHAAAKFGPFSLPAQLRTGIVDGGDLADSVEAARDFDTGSEAPFLLLRLGTTSTRPQGAPSRSALPAR